MKISLIIWRKLWSTDIKSRHVANIIIGTLKWSQTEQFLFSNNVFGSNKSILQIYKLMLDLLHLFLVNYPIINNKKTYQMRLKALMFKLIYVTCIVRAVHNVPYSLRQHFTASDKMNYNQTKQKYPRPTCYVLSCTFWRCKEDGWRISVIKKPQNSDNRFWQMNLLRLKFDFCS